MFESEYVTPGRGQEKGGVENLVGYVRRNFLVPPPEFDDYDSLNAYLAACCDRDARERRRSGRTVAELWREEQESLRPLPARLPAACISRLAKSTGVSRCGLPATGIQCRPGMWASW